MNRQFRTPLFFCLLLCLPILGLSGCDDDSVGPDGNVDYTITPNHGSFSLKGGASWGIDGNTIIAYATDLSFAFENLSETNYAFGMDLEIGALVDGKFTTDPQYVIIDTASLNAINRETTVILAKSKANLEARYIAIGRPASAGWGYPYAWRIRYPDGAKQVTLSGVFEGGQNPNNRYKGVLYTIEQSPEPVGIIDGPDDGDWQASSNRAALDPTYPNPISGTGDSVVPRVGFSVNENAESVTLRLMLAEGKPLYQMTLNNLSPGAHIMNLELPIQKMPGIYRLEAEFKFADETVKARGDIMMRE